MQLVNMKSQAESMANEKIKDLVLTVPGFWTEQERNSIINAAEIAGMRVLTLINDGLAGIPVPDGINDSRNQLWHNEKLLRGTPIPFNL